MTDIMTRLTFRHIPMHCGKKDRKFPSQITDAADHNKPVTENSGIHVPRYIQYIQEKYSTDNGTFYIGILSYLVIYN